MLGGYMSPVNDAYAKPGLAPARHRLHMADLAAAGSKLIMVDGWEAQQPGYCRTLTVMQRIRRVLAGSLTDGPVAAGGGDVMRGQQAPRPGAVLNDSIYILWWSCRT